MDTIIDLCFLCTKDYNCVPVDSKIVSQVEYVLPEITIFNLGIPLRICSVCDGALYAFSKFKQFYVESTLHLETRIKGAQGPPLHTDSTHVVDSQPYNTNHSKPQHGSGTTPQMAQPSLHTDNTTKQDQEFYNTTRTDQNSSELECTKNNSEDQLSAFDTFRQIYENSNQEMGTLDPLVYTDNNETSNTNPEKIEEIFIKEEKSEETSQDMQYFDSILKTALKGEYTSNSGTSDIDGSTQAEKTNEDSFANCDEETNKNYLKCTICNELFTNKTNLVLHCKKNHWRIKKFSCTLCKKSFNHEQDLKKHLEVHNEIKNFQCPVCKTGFTDKNVLIQHIKLHTDQNQLRCETCNDTFSLETYLETHVAHFACPVCTNLFTYKKELELHMKVHTEVKDFLCNLCNKSFSVKSELIQHLKCHSSVIESAINDYKCNICHISFKQKEELNRHIDTHSGDNYLNYNNEEITPELCEEEDNFSAESLPNKSRVRYERAYQLFVNWCDEKSLYDYTETVLLDYFKELVSRNKKSLWTIHSMLKSCILIHKNIDISKYSKLSAYLKKTSEKVKPKIGKVLEEEHINKFIDEAPDDEYLMMKVVLIIGVSGALRIEELYYLNVRDVEIKNDIIIITIPDTKNNMSRRFAIINPKWVALVKKYLDIRFAIPRDKSRFFLIYQKGHCSNLAAGIKTIAGIPSKIANFLKLEDSKEYTGHCFRRSSASLLANPSDLLSLKSQGGRKSAIVVDVFDENSLKRKMDAGQMSTDPGPSTSKIPNTTIKIENTTDY